MERLKVYLDTNMVLDFFVLQGRALERTEPLVPKKFAFFGDQKERFHFVTSVLTMAEIVRELRSSLHWPLERIEKLWEDMLRLLECRYVPRIVVDHRLVQIVSDCAMRLRTLMNFEHVFVAIEEEAVFLTGDKDLIQKLRESRLVTALSYLDFRALAES